MRTAISMCLVALLPIGCAGNDDGTDPGATLTIGGGKSTTGSKTSTTRTNSATGGNSGKRTTGAGGSTANATTHGDAPSTGGQIDPGQSKASTRGGNTSRTSEGSSVQGGEGSTTSRTTGKGFPTGGSKSTSDAGATGGSSTTSTSTSKVEPVVLKKFVGNITTSYNASLDYGGKTYSKYWDQVTPENAGKWGSVQKSPGSTYDWKTLDAIYDYAQKNNVIFKQHAFVWGAMQPSGTPTADQVKDWMKQFCARYPETKLIDVVNEPPPHTTPSYANNMGGGTNGDWKWIANAFIWAREACPSAILILNDYNDIEWSNDNQRMIDIVKKIKALDAPIDAIGAQSHDLDNGSVSNATVKSLLTKLHTDTGLPIYITEMDIDSADDAKQLSLYKTYMPLFLETEWVHGITIWGWHFGQTWSQAPNSGLIRNGNFRSAMTYLMETLGRPTS